MPRSFGETTGQFEWQDGAQVTAETAIFTCSICGEPAREICAYCTKDACGNHHCERCKRCSDCCECEMPLSAPEAPLAEASGPETPVPIDLERPLDHEAHSMGSQPVDPESSEDFNPPLTENPLI